MYHDRQPTPMNRRRFLALLGSGMLGASAGCGADPGSTDTPTATEERRSATAGTPTPTATDIETDPPAPGERDTIFVSPEGDAAAAGSESDPMGSIQAAFERATPGTTIHALPGDYVEAVRTRRGGEAGAPITLTGPPEAVFHGYPDADGPKFALHVEHSHVHVRGMTFDGLWDPDNADSAAGYVQSLVTARHAPTSPDSYHENLVIKPHGVGNTLHAMIHVMRSEGVEVGEFEVIGPGGLAMLEFGNTEQHNGEIVYLGTSPDTIPVEGEGEPWMKELHFEPDTTTDVHVHHIDNSAGHPHAELVDIKDGCSDVLVEYCTDAGGAARYTLPSNNPTSETAISVGGRENVIRWNRLAGSHGQGVEIGSWGVAHQAAFAETKGRPYFDSLSDHGRANSVYGNRIVDYDGLAVQYPVVSPDHGEPRIVEGYGPDAQRHVCGNTVDGGSHGDPASDCPDGVPTTATIGHRGGDSPWG